MARIADAAVCRRHAIRRRDNQRQVGTARYVVDALSPRRGSHRQHGEYEERMFHDEQYPSMSSATMTAVTSLLGKPRFLPASTNAAIAALFSAWRAFSTS